MPAQGGRRFPLRRELGRVHHFDRVIEHALPDDSGIKLAVRCSTVISSQFRGEIGGTIEINPIAPTRPEHELGHALKVSEIARRQRVIGGQDPGIHMGDVPLGLFERDPNGDRRVAGLDSLAKGAIGEHGGTKSGVQDWSDPGGNKWQTGIQIHNHGKLLAGKPKEGKAKRLDLGLLCRT